MVSGTEQAENADLVEDLLAPMPVEEFLNSVYTATFRLFRGTPGRFAHYLDPPKILEIVQRPQFNPAHVTLVHNEQEIARKNFCVADQGGRPRVHVGMLGPLLKAGATMITANMERHHRPLWDLARALERVVRADVNVNVYAAIPGSRGFEAHVDHHDVFVLQVAGKKKWHVAAPTCPAPLVLPDHLGEPPSEMLWSGILEEGDVLYIPRGYWHRAEATDDTPTLHFSCGVQPCTGLHIMHWLCKELMSDPRFRHELPRFAPNSELQRHALELRDALMSKWDARMVEQFVAVHDKRVDDEGDELEQALWRKQP